MLTSLYIKNYALIEEVKLQFDPGFTVITGETGAGKSILLGALGLILGKRADISSIGDAEIKCVIEAHFKVEAYNLLPIFTEQDLDYEAQTIVRREILPSGKSRAFVNDTPVTLSQLSALGERLVDIHSQHQTLEVTDNDFQFMILDAFAENGDLLSDYKNLFATLQKDRNKLKKFQDRKIAAQREEEYNNFLLNELLDAKLKPGEQEELESNLEMLGNVEQITEGLAEANQLLTREELGVIDMLLAVKLRISKLAGYGTSLHGLNTRLESLNIEVEDITETINDIAAATEGDPEQLAKVEDRLNLIFDLQKKHKVASVEELIAIQNELDEQVQSLTDLDNEIKRTEKSIAAALIELDKQAVIISRKREEAIKPLTQNLEGILQQLGMPNAFFEVKLIARDDFRDNGKDDLHFLFTANKGMRPQELKSASGGELSRIMLAIKSVLSDYANLPTLIFDEIDTGVSGEVALKMGEIMKKMGSRMQIISITHLPQIAGQGANHFKVFKNDDAARTITGIEKLDVDSRVAEIAEMLGGKSTSEAALSHARQLLN
ncbi:DNA repair protein RecN [Leeuwenhoekiella sp. A16]|uniref:DNA repair protein RecN n=1 Tax=unclassified Leeuwenhoekiella TaxID=2615029 RepID=UPI003A8137F4